MTTDRAFALRAALLRAATQLCVDKGIENFIIAPGSRSAPLTAALAQQPGLCCRVVPDERAAGYLALGLAQQTRRVVGLVCTSGTAALNLAPAVVEAYYQGVPLLVLTADRPPEWLDQQDNQAIHQFRLYEPHVLASYEWPVDASHPDAQWHVLRTLNEALDRAAGWQPGPVHINVPLREPLYPASNTPGLPLARAPQVITQLPATPQLSEASWQALLASWQQATRKLVLVGLHTPSPRLTDALARLSTRGDTAVIADLTANILPAGTPLRHADAALGTRHRATLAALQPDLVISAGGPITSKYIKAFLRQAAPRAHWHVQPTTPAPDTFQTLTQVVPLLPADFFVQLAERSALLPSAAPHYAAAWRALETKAIEQIAAFAAGAPFGELWATQHVLRALPAASRLQLGNSMAVRYANLLGLPAQTVLTGVHSNRGTSGIDGCVSTAVGAALATRDLTTLITGDLGFFYDRNGLWHAHVPPNLRIVLLNNHGGGIFDIIDGPGSLPAAVQETFFLTPQPLTAARTAADHGLDYWHAARADEVLAALPDFFSPRPRAAILEIETDMAVNSAVFRQFKTLLADLRLP